MTTINTFVDLIVQVKEMQQFTRRLREGLEVAVKLPGNNEHDLKYAATIIDLTKNYDHMLAATIAGAAKLALTHSNEPQEKILEVMSR